MHGKCYSRKKLLQDAATNTSLWALPNMFLIWEVIDTWQANTQIVLSLPFFQILGLSASYTEPQNFSHPVPSQGHLFHCPNNKVTAKIPKIRVSLFPELESYICLLRSNCHPKNCYQLLNDHVSHPYSAICRALILCIIFEAFHWCTWRERKKFSLYEYNVAPSSRGTE
jgi:hypothetical protein